MDVVVTADGGDSDGEGAAALSELRRQLANEDLLRGRVRERSIEDEQGEHLGPLTDALVAALEPGGAFTVLVGAVVAWMRLRPRTEAVTFEITQQDRTVKLVLRRQQAKEYDAVERIVRAAVEAGVDVEAVPQPPASAPSDG